MPTVDVKALWRGLWGTSRTLYWNLLTVLPTCDAAYMKYGKYFHTALSSLRITHRHALKYFNSVMWHHVTPNVGHPCPYFW